MTTINNSNNIAVNDAHVSASKQPIQAAKNVDTQSVLKRIMFRRFWTILVQMWLWMGASLICSNPVFHSRMKHVAIDFHFIRDQVQNGILCVAHVSSADQLVDALTKPLHHARFLDLRSKIGLLPRPPS